jgi:hypothetical protein
MSTGGMLLDGERTAGRDCRSANATGQYYYHYDYNFHYYYYNK